MALVRFGGGVAELRGSIAGNVFSRSRAGAIVRNRAVPVNPNTPAQSLVRANLQLAVDQFNTLTKVQVEGWKAFAATQTRINRLGESYVPSGKQMFTEVAMNLAIIAPFSANQPTLTATEGNPNLPNMSQFIIALTSVAIPITAIDMSNVSSVEGDVMVVQATPQLVPTITNFKKYYRQILVDSLGDISLLTSYTATFPSSVSAPTAGNVIAFRARALNSNTGLSGAWVYADATIP